MAHVLVTRFNLGLGGSGSDFEAWHRHRFSLFEQFCLPSVEAQTCQAFTWLLLLDAHTPEAYRARIATYVGRANIQVHYLSGFCLADVPLILRAAVDPQTEYLISTTLDNDDALARDFVARVQREFKGQDFVLLNFIRGFRYDLPKNRLYACELRCNPFISLIERIRPDRPPRSIVGCLPHSTLAARFPEIVDIRSAPAWLQVIHGRNLEITGTWGRRRIRRDRLAMHFELNDRLPGGRESAIVLAIQNLKAWGERRLIDALSEKQKARLRRRLPIRRAGG